MRYNSFRDSIKNKLEKHPEGLTWKELKRSLSLPYKQPCQEWVKNLEAEIELERKEKKRNSLVWKIRKI